MKIRPFKPSDEAAVVNTVHPDHQRTGIGKDMIKEAEMCLRAVGHPKINLQICRSNTAVLEFYD